MLQHIVHLQSFTVIISTHQHIFYTKHTKKSWDLSESMMPTDMGMQKEDKRRLVYIINLPGNEENILKKTDPE